MKSGEKLEKVGIIGIIGERWEKVWKSVEKWEKMGILGKVEKSGQKWGKVKLIGVFLIKLRSAQASFSSYFHKMAVGDHFGFPIFSKIDRGLPL